MTHTHLFCQLTLTKVRSLMQLTLQGVQLLLNTKGKIPANEIYGLMLRDVYSSHRP